MKAPIKYAGANFKLDDGKYAMVRCEDCGKENYALNVMSGICTWCGFDINKDEPEVKNEVN